MQKERKKAKKKERKKERQKRKKERKKERQNDVKYFWSFNNFVKLPKNAFYCISIHFLITQNGPKNINKMFCGSFEQEK